MAEKTNDIFKVISKINQVLPHPLQKTTSRNYQNGSAYVMRNGDVIGLCFDSVPQQFLHELVIDPNSFPHLKDIVIKSSKITDIPDWIFHLTEIENLILKDLELTSVDDLLGRFWNMKFLALPGNNLTEVEYSDNLDTLFRVNLNRNSFDSFPVLLSELNNLISVTLNDNYINSNPRSIATSTLQSLKMKNNQLSSVPYFLNDQIHLYNLDLSSNFISKIPRWLSEFPDLQYLSLASNKISDIQSNFSNLTNLELLDLQNNPDLKFDISCLYNLSRLKELNLKHSCEDQAVIDKIYAWKKISNHHFNFKH